MPSTPYAKLLASLNGGAPESGAITDAANDDTCQLSAESTAQWNLDTPPRWEIYSYPPGWTGPASGWDTESVTLPFGGTADVYVYTGLGPPPAFDLPAAPTWGKFLMRLTVQGGLLNGIPSPTLVDDSTALEIVSPLGLHDTAVLEGTQFSSARAYVGAVQDNWRTVETAIATEVVQSVTGTAPIVSSGGINPAISITAATTLAPGSMSAADKTKLDSVTVANIPSADEKAGLAGTSGTAPSGSNKLVDNADTRLSDARTPTSHGSTHIGGGSDAIAEAVPSGAAGLLSGAFSALLTAATNAATALTLVLRDAAGRFKAADPSASDDVATKGYVDGAIQSAGSYDFGAFGSYATATVQYMVGAGPNPNANQASPPRGYPVMDSILIERLAVAQNVGLGSAVHRFEVYASIGGAAYAATGKTLDLAITAHYGQITFDPPLSLAAGDRVGLATWLFSGTQSTGATQVGARLTYRAA